MVDQLEHLASSLASTGPGPRTFQVRKACSPARALAVAYLMRHAPAPVVCVAPEWKDAQRFAEDLDFFVSLFRFPGPGQEGTGRALLFPPGLAKPVGLAHSSTTSTHERLAVLLSLLEEGRGPVVLVTALEALRERVPPRKVLSGNRQNLRTGQNLDRDGLASFLQGVGYKRVPLVEARGEYAVRGSLIDLFPLTAQVPFRVDFFGDTIETIRTFLPDSQRTLGHVSSAHVPPAGLYIARSIDPKALRARIKRHADALNLPTTNRMAFLDRLESGLSAPELPIFLPLLYDRLDTLLDYTGNDTLLVLLDPDRFPGIEDDQDAECEESLARLGSRGMIVPSCRDLFAETRHLYQDKTSGTVICFSELPIPDSLRTPATGTDPADTGPAGQGGGLEPSPVLLDSLGIPAYTARDLAGERPRGLSGFAPLIRRWIQEGQRVFLVCRSDTEKARMFRLLEDHGLSFVQPSAKVPYLDRTPGLYLLRGGLSQGFCLPSLGLVFLHEDDIFGKKIRKHRIQPREPPAGVEVRELEPDDYVVHVDFGIARYRGLETLNIRGFVNDYLRLEYANGELYLPVDRASRIQKYVSTEDLPPALDRLGGTSWMRTKQRVRKSVLAMAQELVSLYATRLVRRGHSYSKPDPSYEEFEASFPYEETPDQVRAIEEVLRDMEDDRPMDRLVCGDVGFGKTEVAIRASYKAVMDGKQVAVLVPTTVLAQQHFENFRKRFEGYPVEIEMLSRFRSAKEQRAVMAGLAEGKVDIVIGTHRILQRDVRFRDLGLLILDEEHRFGVRQKEMLKKMRTEVDVLTLSATPIPRTLQMSLLGLRDLSSIQTPPQDRRAIETYVAPFEPEIIRHAVTQELERGGQVFFVHNRVHDIEAVAARLKEIVPEARIAIAHGQMPERNLERVMVDFVQGRYDVLVCTTIIESGLDIPNANTLLVHRADRFGLAQLYQLRGRVGRSERQAYTYLLVPDEDTLTDEARKRLEALYEFTELGSGFRIARYDLEIRGAGNLLGTDQSGHIRAVGYDLYMEMLEKAIRELKGDEVLEEVDPEIHLELPAYLPKDYIEDSGQRLSFYKRLAQARGEEEIGRIRAEMEDRFGPAPDEADTLFELIRIKVRLRRLRVREARLAEDGLMLCFDPQTPLPVDRIVTWAAQEPDRVRLLPNDRLWVRFPVTEPGQRLPAIQNILVQLEEDPSRRKVVHGKSR